MRIKNNFLLISKDLWSLSITIRMNASSNPFIDTKRALKIFRISWESFKKMLYLKVVKSDSSTCQIITKLLIIQITLSFMINLMLIGKTMKKSQCFYGNIFSFIERYLTFLNNLIGMLPKNFLNMMKNKISIIS